MKVGNLAVWMDILMAELKVSLMVASTEIWKVALKVVRMVF